MPATPRSTCRSGARGAILVGCGLRFQNRLADIPVIQRFPHAAGGVATWIRELRLYQWPKNLLVFLPIILAGPLATWTDWMEAVLGFVLLCLLASAGYLANDMLALAADHRHPIKRNRPFASGALPVAYGVLAVPALLLTALVIGTMLPVTSTIVGLTYLCGTLGYSMFLKKVPILDTMILASLFTLWRLPRNPEPRR